MLMRVCRSPRKLTPWRIDLHTVSIVMKTHLLSHLADQFACGRLLTVCHRVPLGQSAGVACERRLPDADNGFCHREGLWFPQKRTDRIGEINRISDKETPLGLKASLAGETLKRSRRIHPNMKSSDRRIYYLTTGKALVFTCARAQGWCIQTLGGLIRRPEEPRLAFR